MGLTSSCTFPTTPPGRGGSATLEINGPDFRKGRPGLIQWPSLHLARKYSQEIGTPNHINPTIHFSAFNFSLGVSFPIGQEADQAM